ncbi:MAG TPA: hypothetical protein VMO47_03030 [Rhodothermales bacterium]|nr:hypothetical protein [Rhodothermales bacterium]
MPINVQYLIAVTIRLAVAVAFLGLVIRPATSNAQTEWISIESGTDSTLLALTFVNPDTGFVGGHGVILRTVDGGETWQDLSPDSTLLQLDCPAHFSQACEGKLATIRSIDFRPSGRGIAVAANFVQTPQAENIFSTWIATVFRSVDWGLTWARVFSADNMLLSRACFLSEFEVLVAGELSTLMRSQDQGLSWRMEFFFPGLITGALACTEEGVVLLGGATQRTGRIATAAIIQSTDKGSSFTTAYSETGRSSIGAFAVLGSGLSFAVTNSSLLVSTDTGATWNSVGSTLVADDVSFVDASHALAVGSHRIQFTEDGGQTWTPESWNSTRRLHAVQLWQDGNAIAVGETGTIAKRVSKGLVASEAAESPSSELSVSHFPNPVSDRIVFDIVVERPYRDLELSIFDALGRLAGRIVEGPLPRGRHHISWSPDKLVSSLYLYSLRAGHMTVKGSFTVSR